MIKHVSSRARLYEFKSHSTTFHMGEFGLQFPLLWKDLIGKIMVRFKGIGAPTHTYMENT